MKFNSRAVNKRIFISYILNERLWKSIVLPIGDTNNSASQLRAANGFQSLKCIVQCEKIIVCMKLKNIIPWKVLEWFLITGCNASKNSFVHCIHLFVFLYIATCEQKSFMRFSDGIIYIYRYYKYIYDTFCKFIWWSLLSSSLSLYY